MKVGDIGVTKGAEILPDGTIVQIEGDIPVGSHVKKVGESKTKITIAPCWIVSCWISDSSLVGKANVFPLADPDEVKATDKFFEYIE